MRSRLSLVSALCGSLVLATAGLLAWAGSASSPASAQVATKLDFRRDIQPLLQEHCIECHGPDEQSGGFRFDSRRSVRKVAGRLQPGSSATSRMYLRLVNDDFGPRMPRDSEQLRPDQIAIVKNWIDQGAEWPDDLAGDDPAPPPPDPVAMQMITALRRADARAFVRLIRAQPQTINRRVIGGATPLMYAALYGDQRAVRLLLDHGADPNIANEAGATALMWAVDDPRITTLLLDRGANVNALTPEGHGALSIAAGRRGADRVVEILLDRGATPSPEAPGGRVLSVSRPTVPLAQAASAGNESVFRMLVERGADLKAAGGAALVSAARGGCGACVEMLIGAVTKADLTYALVGLARYGDTRLLARLIDRGAEVNGRVSRTRRDVRERTPVLLAASSDLVHAETIRMLLARGADINAVGPEGETALDLAKRNGDTDVVRVLVEAGARTGGAFPTVHATPQPASSARAAFARVVPLLQRSDVIFTQKTGCVSCHNNTLTAMTIAAARTRHLPFDDRIAASQREVIASILAGRRERAALGSEITQQAVSNILTGLAAERHTADVTTDVMAYFLKGRQSADGRWRNFLVDHRPPVQHSDIEATATAIRALRVYAPMPRRAAYEDAVHRATTWLLTAQPRTVDERAWQLLGFAWAGVDARDDRVRAAARSLLAEQRADGGWSQLPTLASDAYATGQALVALLQVGAVRSSDPPYRRGVECLLGSQLADGSWYVKSRALAFQPYFESGFPHGSDQWVSMAASNWAAMALASAAAPDASTPQARLSRAHSHERNIGKAAQALTPQPSHAGVIDHFVPHISTQRANEGSRVSLFVRERRSDPSGPAVLLVHGRSAAAIPSFDLEYRDYSWMAYLAAAGFDVFALICKATGVRPSLRSWTTPATPPPTIKRSTSFRILSGRPARPAIRMHSVASRRIGTRSTRSWSSYVRVAVIGPSRFTLWAGLGVE